MTTPKPRRLIIIGLIAAAIAALSAWGAPREWAAGSGTLIVSAAGDILAELPVDIGQTHPLERTDAQATVRLPRGVPLTGTIEVIVTLPPESDVALSSLQVVLSRADAPLEIIPVLNVHEAQRQVLAKRVPPHGAMVLLALLGAVVVLWVTEILPLWITSLAVPVVLVFGGVASGADALAPFFHPVIALFFAGFMLAEAMARTGLDRRIAVTLVARLGKTPARLFGALMGVSAVLSMWMSNTAAVALLVPIALAITAPLHAPAYRKAIVLGIAYAATVGGTGSAIGTPANPLAIEFLKAYAGRQISFAGWFLYGLPMVVVALPIIGLYLWRRTKVDAPAEVFARAQLEAAQTRASFGPLTRAQGLVIAALVVVVAGWLTQSVHGVSPGVVGLFGVVLLGALGQVESEDLKRISWSSLLTFGGGLCIGQYFVATGTSDHLATRLAGLADVPSFVAVALVATATLAMTTVASNTATAAVLVPLAIPLAALLGIDPVQLVVVVAIASSIDFALVIGTPPTMIAHSTGLVTAREIFRLGAPLDIIVLVLLVTVVSWVWSLMGVVG